MTDKDVDKRGTGFYDKEFNNLFILKGFLYFENGHALLATMDAGFLLERSTVMELKGSLRNFSLPDIVQLLGTTGRTGVLVVTVGPDRASVFFEEGNIIHAEYRDLRGQGAITKAFSEREGSFQFLSDVEAPEKTVDLDWMNVLMEAARVNDEIHRDRQEEAGPPGAGKSSKWDPERVKAGMAGVLEKAFGKKARKIAAELEKNPGSKLSLLEFCEKAEKYIYVFIDNKRAEEVAGKMRAVIEESLL